MTEPHIIDILNELLAAERSSAAQRLIESTVFVAQVGTNVDFVVKRLAEEQADHAARLTALILNLGGSPGMRIDDLATADLHYQALRNALPQLVSHIESNIRKYHAAMPKLASEPAAVALAGQILARHEENRDRLASQYDAPATTAD